MQAGDALHETIYAELKRVARAGGTTSYRALAALAGLDLDRPADRGTLARTLRAISTAEHQQGRPLLSAVVVLGGRRMPGRGFFALARELGRHTGDDDASFFRDELAGVHTAWR